MISSFQALPIFFQVYLSSWIILMMICFYLMKKFFSKLSIFSKQYLYYIGQPWKVITFTIAVVSFVVMAPYSGDPT